MNMKGYKKSKKNNSRGWVTAEEASKNNVFNGIIITCNVSGILKVLYAGQREEDVIEKLD
jgi:hypothetical protein